MGGRHQEIVFIGEKMKSEGLRAAFDQCLLTDLEMTKWERIMRLKNRWVWGSARASTRRAGWS